MDDLLGLGKILPIDKLIDLLEKSFGAMAKPYLDRRDVDTEAYRIKTIAAAKVEAMKIVSGAIKENASGLGALNYSEGGINVESAKQLPEQHFQSLPSPDLEERTRARVEFQESKKQINIEAITASAAENLKEEPSVADEPVDEGWASRFFKYAEDISDEGMQTIWGRILAGEIKQPNTYSLRTLEILRNLSKTEAEVFTLACNLALAGGGSTLIFKNNDEFLKQYGLNYDNLSMLREIGMIQEGEFTTVQLLQIGVQAQTFYTYGNILITLDKKPDSPQKDIPVYVFSRVGNQLLNLVKTKPNVQYLNAFAAFIKSEDISPKYAFILSRDKDSIRHTQPMLEFPMNPSIQL